MGSEAHAQVFNCDAGRSVGKQIQLVLGALNPLNMNNRLSSNPFNTLNQFKKTPSINDKLLTEEARLHGPI